jgi:hypothetical protein
MTNSAATAPDVPLGFDLTPSVRAESLLLQVGKTLRSIGFEESERTFYTQPMTRLAYARHSTQSKMRQESSELWVVTGREVGGDSVSGDNGLWVRCTRLAPPLTATPSPTPLIQQKPHRSLPQTTNSKTTSPTTAATVTLDRMLRSRRKPASAELILS